MPLIVPDEVLRAAKLSEPEARTEIACRLFEAGKLMKAAAARWAGLTRVHLEAELLSRKIPLYSLTMADLETDLEALERLRD